MSKFDLSKTRILQELFAIDPDRRDDAWRERFYAAVPDASLMAFEPQVELGPDRFPYFQLVMPEEGPFTAHCLSDVLGDCLEHGCGLVVFPDARRAGRPWWFFYGDLLSYRLFGRFDGDPSAPPRSDTAVPFHYDGTYPILRASPSEALLPACAQRAIGRFFRDTLKHPDPRIALIIGLDSTPGMQLMVNLTPDHYGGDLDTLRAALNRTSWFLPASHRLSSMPPEWSDADFMRLD